MMPKLNDAVVAGQQQYGITASLSYVNRPSLALLGERGYVALLE
jgi:hypothetical protein